jgi:hypothetical protein
MMASVNRRQFEDMAFQSDFGSGVPIITNDGRMGLINHWNDETCMVDIYVGNGCETFHVRWSKLSDTWAGIVVDLAGAIAA